MEKTPLPEDEDEIVQKLVEESMSAVEESANDVHEFKKVIALIKEEELRFRAEFIDLCADLNPNNPLEADLLAQCKEEEKKYADMTSAKIRRMEEMLQQLEQAHARQLAYFEKAKAIKRQMDYGISGTAH